MDSGRISADFIYQVRRIAMQLVKEEGLVDLLLCYHVTSTVTLADLLLWYKIYGPSSSLFKGKYLPFSHSPLRLNMFRLFVILSLTQVYRYTPEIFLFSTATFKYTYRDPADELDNNIQRTSPRLLFSHLNGYRDFRFALDFS